jgi:hypothetical protein
MVGAGKLSSAMEGMIAGRDVSLTVLGTDDKGGEETEC